MLTHLPSRRSLTASDLSCRAMASRQTPANVDGTVDSSWPGETLASAAEDTGKRSPSIGQGYSPKLPDRERAEHRLHPPKVKIQPNRPDFMRRRTTFRLSLPVRAPEQARRWIPIQQFW